jgi:TMEM175 potassium channel family protein
VLAGLFWFLHHMLMQFVRHMTRPLILLNLLFLMSVSLLPFSAAMLGRFLHAPIALQIYYGHQLVLGLLLAVQWEVVRRNDLTTEALTPADRIAMPFRLWTIPVACVVALITTAVQPEWAQSAFAFTAFGGRMVSRRREAAVA